MEYGILIIIIIISILEYMEISKLKSQVERQQKQIDKLCKATENAQLSAQYVSDDMKHDLFELKKAGKDVEAVKKLRKATSMGLLEAKEFLDKM